MKSAWIAGVFVAMALPASAGELSEMVGAWQWEGYTVTVTECDATTVCAEVTDGPQNVGMQMLKTTPQAAGDAWTAEVFHPATGELYYTKMSYDGSDTWTMAGCTSNGVCAEGAFSRK